MHTSSCAQRPKGILYSYQLGVCVCVCVCVERGCEGGTESQRGMGTQADVLPPNPAGIDRDETTKVMTRYRPVRQLQEKGGTAQASAELGSASSCNSALQRPGQEQLLRPHETVWQWFGLHPEMSIILKILMFKIIPCRLI